MPDPGTAGEVAALDGDEVAALDADETVDALVALGIDQSEAEEAVSEGRVPLVLVRQLIGQERPYTLAEVADRGGIDPDALREVLRALGISPQDAFGESDVAEAKQLAELLEHFSLDTVVRLARVRGMAVSRIALGDVGAVRDEVIQPLRRAGADDLQVAVALAELAETLLPMSTELLVNAHLRALQNVLSSELANLGARESSQELDIAVGFVDLVGYTALSARVDPGGLDEVLDAFEDRVLAVAGEVSGVDLVKFLGDAAMLVSADAVLLADTLLELVEPTDALEDVPLRAGMSFGGTLIREGDYYGAPVNLAARLTDQARPWTMLADDELDEVLGERFRVKRTRPMRIRGDGVRRPLAVRRSDSD